MTSLVSYEQRIVNIQTENGALRIHYVKLCPPSRLAPKGVIVLLHDYFRTSYQFRYVIDLIAMGGYVTIAPDLLDLVSRTNGSAAVNTIASHLYTFLSKTWSGTTFHLVGCGFGAQLAAEIVSAYPELVASLICSNDMSPDSQVQQVMSLPFCPSQEALAKAFRTDLGMDNGQNELLSRLDIEEYVEVYSHPEILSEMQRMCRTQTRSLTIPETSLPINFMRSNPEQQPEEWAITILSFLNEKYTKMVPTPARL